MECDVPVLAAAVPFREGYRSCQHSLHTVQMQRRASLVPFPFFRNRSDEFSVLWQYFKSRMPNHYLPFYDKCLMISVFTLSSMVSSIAMFSRCALIV